MWQERKFWFRLTASFFWQDIKAKAGTTPQLQGPFSLWRDGYRWKVTWYQA